MEAKKQRRDCLLNADGGTGHADVPPLFQSPKQQQSVDLISGHTLASVASLNLSQ